MSVTLADLVAKVVILVVGWVVGLVNAAWSAVDWTGANAGLAFLGRFDAWIPVSSLAAVLSLMMLVASVAVVIKFGQKLVDWLPFT